MARSDDSAATTIDGHTLRLTSLNKVMYPETGTTKQEVLSYYAAVAPLFLPHARMRPATRKRFVHGVGTHADPGKVFFEKNLPRGAPRWLSRRTMMHSDRDVTYPLINDAATLVWCAQMGALELHVPQWTFGADDEPQNPDRLVLDLDPGPGADLDTCVEVALLCKEILDDVGLEAVPVTSGSKGIHLYARLDGAQTSQQASALARALATGLEGQYPKLIVSDMKKSLRGGKVLLDWSQNNAAKTTIAPYSLRGTMRPQVACPRDWSEIVAGLRQLELYEVIDRVVDGRDPMAALGQALTKPPSVQPPPVQPATSPARPRVVAASRRATPSADQLRPMQATTGTPAQVRGSAWAYEMKWDGYRALVRVQDDTLRLTSRNGNDLTSGYRELQSALEVIGAGRCVLDGEIVVLDEQGVPRFGALQNLGRSRRESLRLMLFDVLLLDGESLLDAPYEARREVLEDLVTESALVNVPPRLTGSVDDALEVSRSLQLEGVVAKRIGSTYLPGARSSSWVKIKHIQTQEVVIVGWSPGSGNRQGTIGSLLMAIPVDGRLRYVGKVGSGFDDAGLRQAARRLAKVQRGSAQITDVPAADARAAQWVTPVHVGEVSYSERTTSGRLRHPVWKGWRDDKSAADVRLE